MLSPPSTPLRSSYPEASKIRDRTCTPNQSLRTCAVSGGVKLKPNHAVALLKSSISARKGPLHLGCHNVSFVESVNKNYVRKGQNPVSKWIASTEATTCISAKEGRALSTLVTRHENSRGKPTEEQRSKETGMFFTGK